MAAGRKTNLSGIDADALGLKLDGKKCIVVDAHQRTSLPGVYAIGDVVGGFQLAHAAYAEGEAKAADEANAEAAAAETPEAAAEPAAQPAEEAAASAAPAEGGEKPVCDPEAPNPNPVEAGPAVAPKDASGKFDPTKIAEASDFGDWEEQGCKG